MADDTIDPEVQKFLADPCSWLEEWATKNGPVLLLEAERGGYIACLYVSEPGEGKERLGDAFVPQCMSRPALSTGVHKNLALAIQSAIIGLNGLRAL